MGWLKFLGLFTAAAASLHCGSVRLVNDSPFKLTATVLAADGRNMGSVTLSPRDVKDWSDGFGTSGYSTEQGSPISVTPYTIFWSCEDGTEFSVCNNTGDAATVAAEACDGNRMCKPPQPSKRPQWRSQQREQSQTPSP